MGRESKVRILVPNFTIDVALKMWAEVCQNMEFLSVQCYAWTEYKFTCVCVCAFVNSTLCGKSYVGDGHCGECLHCGENIVSPQ